MVPNPSFEIDTVCPHNVGEIFYAIPWFQPCIHTGNTTVSSSSELFNSCDSSGLVSVPYNGGFSGYQAARTGVGYAGIVCHFTTTIYWREYLEVPLLDSLIPNHRYCVEFYVNEPDFSHYGISNMGAYFSNDSLLDTSYYHAISYVIPQVENPVGNYLTDTLNWMLVSGNFIATGGEKFLTIGNFHTPATTDTVSTNSSNTSPTVYYYIDDISVTDCTTIGISEINNQPSTIEISPNPATSEIKITTTNAVMKEAHIYTMMGQCILQSTINNRQSTIDISALPAGMYIAEVITEKGVIRKRFVKQ